ncbi:hypothetical protein RYX36_010293 [Vicia faba]
MDAVSEHLSVDTGTSIKEAEVKDESSFLGSGSTTIPFTTRETGNVVLLIIRSENVCITFHIPIWTSEEPNVEPHRAESQYLTTLNVSSNFVEEKDAKFLTFSDRMNSFELVIRSRDIKLKSDMERLSIIIILVVNGTSAKRCNSVIDDSSLMCSSDSSLPLSSIKTPHNRNLVPSGILTFLLQQIQIITKKTDERFSPLFLTNNTIPTP